MGRTANRFDFLRLVFAGVVAIYHAVFLASLAPQSGLENGLAQAAELSIQGFFIISGALVLGSLIRSQSLGGYAEKRIRRLMPAYAVIILIPAIISLILTGQFRDVISYVLPNLAFLNFFEPTLPGLFEGHRNPAVNGALWTLKIEVMFYAALPVIWWFIRKPGALCKLAWVAMFVGAEIWRQYFLHLDHPLSAQLGRQLPGQMGYFAMGMLMNQKWHRLENPKAWWAIIGLGLVAISLWQPVLHTPANRAWPNYSLDCKSCRSSAKRRPFWRYELRGLYYALPDHSDLYRLGSVCGLARIGIDGQPGADLCGQLSALALG